MHRYMKNVVLATSNKELMFAVKQVMQHENKALQEFYFVSEKLTVEVKVY